MTKGQIAVIRLQMANRTGFREFSFDKEGHMAKAKQYRVERCPVKGMVAVYDGTGKLMPAGRVAAVLNRTTAKPKTKAPMPLIPVDMNKCQAEVRSFMTLGPGFARCCNAPSWIATEVKPGKDGQIGQMSLCDECKAQFIKNFGRDYAVFTRINEGK